MTDVNIRKKKVDIGVRAKLVVAEYKKHKNFNQNTLDRFYKDCGVFLSSIVKHMLEKSPIRRQIVRCASSLDPTIISNKDAQESCKLKFSALCEKLAQLQRIPASLADRANEEYKKFWNEVVPRHSQEFLDFNIYSERLDSFLQLLLSGNKNYDNLWLICKIIFILFHGQAHIERGFKNNKDFEKDNQGELSLVSLRVIHEHMATNSVDSFSIPFTQEMVKSVKAARSRYEVYLNKQAQAKTVNTKELKRKIICDEIVAVRQKKACYEECIKRNALDADKISNKAEEKHDFSLLSQANDLRRANLEKQKLIIDLEKMEAELIGRRDSIV